MRGAMQPVARLTPADRMAALADDALMLAQHMARPARSHHEIEVRIAEGERISAEIKRLVRG